jgi:O-succinylbenzoate synthase
VAIQSIAVHRVQLDLRVPFTTSFGTSTYFRKPFVIVTTTDGLRGVGEIPTLNEPAYKAECDTPAAITSLVEFLVPSVFRHQREKGAIQTIAQLHESYEWVKGAVFAKSGIEAALWDIEAQRHGKPLWQLWGGTRKSFTVGVSIGGKTVEQVLSLAENAAGLGYKRFKVKIWPGFDIDVVRALRERFPSILLQVDANSAYDRSNWTALKALDGFDLLLIEQPLYDDDIVLHSEIAKELKTPVCLDESIHSLRDTEAAVGLWKRNGAQDRLVINIKPPRVSGFTEAIAIAKYCRSEGVKTWIGGMLDSAWGKAFNLNFNTLEEIDLPGDHFSPSGAYFKQDLAGPELAAPDGVYHIGDGVSTGLTFDWDAFAQLGELVYEQTA